MEQQGQTNTEHAGSNPAQETRKLRKSATDKIIDGVCGGLARYFGIDSNIVRLLVIAFSVFSIGAGVVFYLVAMLLMPTAERTEPTETIPRGKQKSSTAGLVIGVIVTIVGLSLLLNVHIFSPFGSIWHSFGRLSLPLILILVGGALLLETGSKKAGIPRDQGAEMATGGRLARSLKDRKISGVCGGIGEHFGVDPTLVRIAFVLLAIASLGLSVILYFILAFVLPRDSQ